jgi:hypothetical protein
METSPLQFTQILVAMIAGIVIIGSTFAGFAYWISTVAVNGRTNATSIDDLYGKIEKHTSDRAIHPSSADLDRRFAEFHQDLSEIKRTVTVGFSDVNRRLDTVLASK